MPKTRKNYDREFREGAVRIVEETNKPIAQVTRDLGVNEGHAGQLGPTQRRRARGSRRSVQGRPRGAQAARAEVAEARMERDVLKRSMVLPVLEATK